MAELKARFHLPDFNRHMRVNYAITQMLKGKPEWFRDGVEIASVFGAFPPSVWNGGRTMAGFRTDDAYITGVLRLFNDQGIPVRFTFTNPMLREEHLSDPFCNRIMKLADNGLNEVIVFSPLLEQYIRTNYPNYKITSSTCKRLTNPDDVIAELNRDYHVVVLDYDLNNQWEILDRLPHHEKIEMLACSTCVPHCKRRSREYEVCGLQQIYYNEHLKKFPGVPFRASDYMETTLADFDCIAMKRTVFDIVKLPHHISPELIWKEYLPRGINQFKLSGRGSSKLWLIELYAYYLFRPECRDEARFMLLHNLDRIGDIHIDT